MFPKALELQQKFDNLVILRSFSKIYGLAASRIGFALMNKDFVSKMNDSQIPYSMNNLSTKAAIANLNDDEFIDKSSMANAAQRDYLFKELTSLGFNTLPTQANFIYLWFQIEEEKTRCLQSSFEKME